MRKVVYGVGISLDGYLARPDGSVDYLAMPKDYSMGPFIKRMDVALMGRKTYEMGLKMSGGNFNSRGIKCYVFSRNDANGEHLGATFVSESPKKFVAALRKKKGKDIWLMGGGELASDFLNEDLVDEIYLGVLPVLIGEGIRAFPEGFPQRQFTLVENKTFSQGLIALRYRRGKASKKAKKKVKK